MAANEKVLYANQYTTHAGKLFAPGERISGHPVATPEVLRHMQANGVTTDHAGAQRAEREESARRERVAAEQQERSEARNPEERSGR